MIYTIIDEVTPTWEFVEHMWLDGDISFEDILNQIIWSDDAPF